MTEICASCHQKQDLINKYTKLIKLLKTKQQKLSQSTVKSQNFSIQSFSETFGSTVKESSSKIKSDLLDSNKEPIMNKNKEQKTECSKLALTVICNKIKKALMKKYFEQIKSAVKKSCSFERIPTELPQLSPKQPFQIVNLIEQTLAEGKKFKYEDISSEMTLKELYRNIFSLQTLNGQLREGIKKLSIELVESEKRFYKQTEKKRESLEAVAQEMREKNDIIADLQHTIKQYQKISGKSFQKINLENVLIEDELELKKTCLRLEIINQKLNSDLRNAQSKLCSMIEDILSLKKENISLKFELNQVKEHNFDLIDQTNKTNELRQTYSSLCQKLNQKIEKIKLSEKKNVLALKSNSKENEILSFCDLISNKNTEASSEFSPLSRKSSLRELQIEQKIESIFSFLFNIHEEEYKITNEEMFDEDELNLLRLHKKFYVNSVHNQNPQAKPRTQQVIKNENLDETDEIVYLQPQQMSDENSFFNALESPANPKSKDSSPSNNIKIIELEIQKSKLIQKISDLKKIHMHIREVFLNFLKTMELNNLKPETLRILEIVFDVFEYSEDEKSCLFREKKKKLWGIL